MMYASEQIETALAETDKGPGNYAVGRFATTREILALDLTRLPRVPSIFEELSDTLEYDPRPRLIFLHNVAQDISRPIAHDDREHIEYVPTQAVTEYLRTVTTIDGRQIEGVRYRSSRRRLGTSLVLFADQNNLMLPESEQSEVYGIWHDRWLRLMSNSVSAVTAENIESWARGCRLI
jgi:hypothetical protein